MSEERRKYREYQIEAQGETEGQEETEGQGEMEKKGEMGQTRREGGLGIVREE